uniref:Uncharacterized protein n=1 Tax=Molossus molossus TaxID=27622 RepID=A0A7J8EEK5_MOLMO|nr:hypothetical protein HJG59_008840 [Molossus molossus]
MSRCIGTSALNHVWRMKGWTEPNPETHEKTRRMEPSSPRTVCVFAAWPGGERPGGGQSADVLCPPPCASPPVLCACKHQLTFSLKHLPTTFDVLRLETRSLHSALGSLHCLGGVMGTSSEARGK